LRGYESRRIANGLNYPEQTDKGIEGIFARLRMAKAILDVGCQVRLKPNPVTITPGKNRTRLAPPAFAAPLSETA